MHVLVNKLKTNGEKNMNPSYCLKTSLSTQSVKNQENADIKKIAEWLLVALKNILETIDKHAILDKAQRTQRILRETA